MCSYYVLIKNKMFLKTLLMSLYSLEFAIVITDERDLRSWPIQLLTQEFL